MSELAACRMCLAVDARMYAIADTPLQDVYERITDIPLQNGDNRPKKVCYLCHHLLRKNQAFTEKCVKADKLLRLALDSGIELTEAYIRLMDTSDVCSSLCVSRPVFENYVLQEQSPDTEVRVKFEPPDVKEEMEIEIEGIDHNRECPDNVKKERSTPIPWTQSNALIDAQESSLTENSSNVKQKRECSTDVVNSDATVQNQQENISKSNLQRCARNSEILNEEEFLNRSIQEHTAEKHLRDHEGEKPHRCSRCDKAFSDKRNLNRHMLIHSGEKPYACTLCSRVFSHKSHLNTHILIHAGEKPHQCRNCNKAFTQKNNLNQHMLLHTGEKPHRCSYCNKTFSAKNHLNQHILMHTGEKPHRCNYCNKEFTQKSNLNQHIFIHTGEKPHICSHCNKTFSDKSNLNRHILLHSAEKLHRCSHCNVEFPMKRHLNQHMLIHTETKIGSSHKTNFAK